MSDSRQGWWRYYCWWHNEVLWGFRSRSWRRCVTRSGVRVEIPKDGYLDETGVGWRLEETIVRTCNYPRQLDRNFISIISCDNLSSMRQALPGLREKLGSDREYFSKVYSHTFNFSRNEGQRSLGQFYEFSITRSCPNESSATETAKGLWNLLLPHGLKGGAISTPNAPDDVDINGKNLPAEQSWTIERIAMWFQFLDDKGLKGISRDSWLMVSGIRLMNPCLARVQCRM